MGKTGGKTFLSPKLSKQLYIVVGFGMPLKPCGQGIVRCSHMSNVAAL